MDKKYYVLAKNIKYLRKKNHMTQKKLGELLHVTPGTVSKWEVGKNYPSDRLKELANIFGVSVDSLIGCAPTQDPDPVNYFEIIETFSIPRREGVFADIIKNHLSKQYEIWIYDFNYGALKCLVDIKPLKNNTPKLFKEDFLSKSDAFLQAYRAMLVDSGLSQLSAEDREFINELENGFDSIEEMHKRLGIE